MTLTAKQSALLLRLNPADWRQVTPDEQRTAMALYRLGLIVPAGAGPGSVAEAMLTEAGAELVAAMGVK